MHSHETFLAIIGHDLRSPLGAVSMSAFQGPVSEKSRTCRANDPDEEVVCVGAQTTQRICRIVRDSNDPQVRTMTQQPPNQSMKTPLHTAKEKKVAKQQKRLANDAPRFIKH